VFWQVLRNNPSAVWTPHLPCSDVIVITVGAIGRLVVIDAKVGCVQ